MMPEVLRRQQSEAVNGLPPAAHASLEDAERSARALIARIDQFARSQGTPLSTWDLWVLKHPLPELIRESSARREPEGMIRARVVDLNNRAVRFVRGAITYEKKFEDTFCLTVRPGSRIPAFWQLHYEVIYVTQLPWLVTSVMQNVFLGNPLDNERRPWKSG
jgi:hypothetical protein